MKIHADFSQRALVHSADLAWQASPMAGVDRRPLDRIGGEVARATSVVRYAPGSEFSPHIHTGGEEFLVLEGVFQDEHGDFPAGSYIRNPPQSRHKPGSEPGCVIFVKLWQFQPNDRTHVRLRSDCMAPVPHRDHPGVSVLPLYRDAYEDVAIYTLDAQAVLQLDAADGLELFVLEGELDEADSGALRAHSWLRLPSGDQLALHAGTAGARLWLKQGHLPRVDEQIARVQSGR